MSFDMSQFYQVFFDESREHLDAMEALLLAIDVAAPEGEDLNAIFRAAHSIKGSAATFGFSDVAALTHVMETLLDHVRKGTLPLTEDIVDASLASGDVLRNLLAAHEGHGDADLAAAEAMQARLQRLTDTLLGAPGALSAPPGQGATAAPAGPVRTTCYRLQFSASGTDARGGEGVENLLRELRELGEVRDATPPAEGGTRWTVELASDIDADTLRSVLEFVADSGSISVDPVGPAQAAPAPAGEAWGLFEQPATPAGDDPGYGFFEPVADPATEPETAYGLFDANPPAPPAADSGYGFFGPLPDPPPESPAALTAAAGILHAPDMVPARLDMSPGPLATAQPHIARDAAKSAKADNTSIRVNIERVDQMINLVGELVITQAMISQAASQLDPALHERLHNGIAMLERNTRDLQESVMSIRMLPMSTVFSRFPRVVRDLSAKLGKKVELVTSGESTELDKSLIERITDPLTHLIRNSLDHGIESPERRREAGKSEQGRINLRAYHQSGNIVIEVADDGAGLNRARILSKARERGLPVSDAMTDQDVWQLIFEPGFSTADAVTDVSGRGVGMDVVKRNIAALGGRIELDSMLGMGTRVTVRLPLTLAILDGMSVDIAGETYIIPLDYVVESLQATRAMLKPVSGVDRLLEVRGEFLPIVDLHEAFDSPGERRGFDQGIMVILEADGTKAAAFVDGLIGQHQVVIKSLEANYRRVPGVTGATIMGDGHVALILDPPQLVAMARRAAPAAA